MPRNSTTPRQFGPSPLLGSVRRIGGRGNLGGFLLLREVAISKD